MVDVHLDIKQTKTADLTVYVEAAAHISIMLFSSILAAAVALVGASVTDASPNKINLAREPVARFGSKYMGCYDSINGFKKENTTQFQTESECGIKHCVPLGKPVIAINDQDCYCADKLPSKSHKVDDKKCSQICPGYDKDNCM